MEGAEKQNADHVAHTVSECDEHKNAGIDDVGEVQETDDRIEGDPGRRHREGTLARHKNRLGFFRGDKSTCKLLLATGAFEA